MEQEFIESYDDLFSNSFTLLRKSWEIKLKAMQICSVQQSEKQMARFRRSSLVKKEIILNDNSSEEDAEEGKE